MILSCKKTILFLAIIFLCLYNILSNGFEVIKESKFLSFYRVEDNITRWENKYENMKNLLPDNAIIGYFTNKDFSNVEKMREFYLSQYTLAPRIIVNSLTENYVIANVDNLFNPIEFCKKHQLKILANPGNGLILFERYPQ